MTFSLCTVTLSFCNPFWQTHNTLVIPGSCKKAEAFDPLAREGNLILCIDAFFSFCYTPVRESDTGEAGCGQGTEWGQDGRPSICTEIKNINIHISHIYPPSLPHVFFFLGPVRSSRSCRACPAWQMTIMPTLAEWCRCRWGRLQVCVSRVPADGEVKIARLHWFPPRLRWCTRSPPTPSVGALQRSWFLLQSSQLEG